MASHQNRRILLWINTTIRITWFIADQRYTKECGTVTDLIYTIIGSFIMHDITIITGYAYESDLIGTKRGLNPGPPGKKPPLCHLSHRISIFVELSTKEKNYQTNQSRSIFVIFWMVAYLILETQFFAINFVCVQRQVEPIQGDLCQLGCIRILIFFLMVSFMSANWIVQIYTETHQ